MSSKDKSILSPVSQKEFWSELRPDLSDFLDMNEEKESWTYKYNEVPDLFLSLSAALPKVASLPPTGEAKGIIEDLIPILSSLPMRESISAIMWMDRAIINEGYMQTDNF